MSIIYFVIAVFALLLGHYIKTIRWEMFLRIYERPSKSILLRSMSMGYLLNFIFPLRIGDVYRFIYVGKKLKNGLGFAASTIIVDRYLDILAVTILFLIMQNAGIESKGIEGSAKFYFIASIALMILMLIAMWLKGSLKKIAIKFSSIFNEKIKFKLLFFFWNLICAFKDLLKVNWKKLLGSTIIMWSCYMCSYYFLAKCLSFFEKDIQLIDIFSSFFSKASLDVATFSTTATIANFSDVASLVSWLYMLVPLVILLIISYLPQSIKQNALVSILKGDYGNNSEVNILPQISEKERLRFLERYFGNEEQEYLSKFIELNKNISIVQDFSAGSNATTMLCIDKEKTFYRKYAFGLDGNKLLEQVEWIHQNENKIPLPHILHEELGKGYCSYDMQYDSNAIGMFYFVHSNPIEISKKMLQSVLEVLQTALYDTSKESFDKEILEQYLGSKVVNNLEIIYTASELKSLLDYEELDINGVTYKNLNYYLTYLSKDSLEIIFSHDICCNMHGDLTIENIVCKKKGVEEMEFYFIDPNPSNTYRTMFMDYAKLLQSLHGGYEFLLLIQTISIEKNRISFIESKSQTYLCLFQHFLLYLEKNFSKEQVKSIFYHEIIHWLRLMPYKIRKGSKEAVVFYIGLIKVLNYVIKEYEEN